MPAYRRTAAEREALDTAKSEVLAFVQDKFPGAEIEFWRDQGDYVALYLRIDDSRCWEVLDAVEPLLQEIAQKSPFLLGVVPLPAKEPATV